MTLNNSGFATLGNSGFATPENSGHLGKVKSGFELFSIILPAARTSVKANAFSEKSAKYAENILRLTSRHPDMKYAHSRPETAHSPILLCGKHRPDGGLAGIAATPANVGEQSPLLRRAGYAEFRFPGRDGSFMPNHPPGFYSSGLQTSTSRSIQSGSPESP